MRLWAAVSNAFFRYVPGVTPENFALVETKFQENAFLTVFTAAFTPIPFKVFTIAAGVFHVSLWMLVIGSVVGRGGRFFLVAALLYVFGPPVKKFIEKYFNLLTLVFVALLVVAVVVWSSSGRDGVAGAGSGSRVPSHPDLSGFPTPHSAFTNPYHLRRRTRMAIMVTGGAGYIGSHAVQRLRPMGTAWSALTTSSAGTARPWRSWHAAGDRLTFVAAEVGDRDLMLRLIESHGVDTVMHFAALAYVGEREHAAALTPRNAASMLGLLEAVEASHALPRGGVSRFVFSSTCASYGEPARENIPIRETCPQSPINPYGWSKLHGERMLMDFADMCARAGRPFATARLRYFNVAGSDPAGLIGEHHEPETHVIPVALQAVLGQREAFTIFGTDYPTPDGTCIRDYVHVVDLVDAHVAVMNAIKPGEQRVYNLGIGNGFSVRQVIDSVQRVTGTKLKIKEGPRRPATRPNSSPIRGRFARN